MTVSFKSQSGQSPTAFGTLLQNSAYGATIPTIYGLTQSVLLPIWAANLRQGGGGIKKFKQVKKGITNYEENIDFLLGHNPIKGVLQVMVNGSNYPLAFKFETFSNAGGRGSFSVTDPNFYFVIGASVKAPYSFTINDYGGQGPQTLAGEWEIPLWNELEAGPDPTAPTSYRAWPYCLRWQPGMGPTIEVDAEYFPAGDVTIYYAQMTAATSNQPPIVRLFMAFEPQLGSGDEYSNAGNDSEGNPYTNQQIVYPHFAGLQSSTLDLGASGAIAQMNPEVCGKWGIYPTGDADFADMIEDVFKSGLAQAAIAAETSTQPQPATTQMERGLSSYDMPGTIQKKIDRSFAAALPPMQYNMPNTKGNVLVCVAVGAGTLGISSANGEAWTKVYADGAGYQIWYAEAVGGPNVVTVSGTSAPWEMCILEIGGVGTSVPGSVMTYPTAHVTTQSGTGTASATDGGACSLSVVGVYPPVTAADRGTASAYWNGFPMPGLPVGAVITSIVPVVAYAWAVAEASVQAPAGPPGYGFANWGASYAATPSTGSGTFAGSSIGTTSADVTGWAGGVELDYSGDGAIFDDTLEVNSIALQINYTVPVGPLAGDVVDAVSTASKNPTVASTVAPGLPAYLLAISLYSGGGATAVSDQPLWDAVTPANFADQSPGTFQIQERIIRSPGTYVASGAGGSPDSICLIALKAVQPPPYPKPLSDFIDLPSFDQVRAQCRAGGLWGSLSMNSQSSASDWIKSLCQAANAAPVFLGDQLSLYPYSEVSAAGNGAFYAAQTASGPVAELDADNGDFTAAPELDTVDRLDLPNVLQMQCIDREANYVQVTVQTPDPASVGLYGVRKADPIVNNAVQDPGVARTLLGIAVRRNQYGGDVWQFSTTARWSLLSPMDLVTLTDTLQGLVGQPVRITQYDENDAGGFDGKAEPFVYGMCAPTPLLATIPKPNASSPQQSAGDVNPPVIFEPTPGLYPGLGGDQIWVVVSSGNPNFGGAQLFVSTDGGASYNPCPGGADANSNIVIGSATTGILTADWPAASDPDTANNLEVNLAESDGVLESISTAAENNFELPCYVQSDQLAMQVDGSVNVNGGNVGAAYPFSLEVGGTAVASLGEIDVETVQVAVLGMASGSPLAIEVGGILICAAQQVDVNGTAIAVDGAGGFGYELMSYAVASLTAPNQYALQATGAGNFLRRAILDAPDSVGTGVDHGAGARFALLNPSGQGILKMALPSQYIGQTLMFKVCSFNTFGAALQSLSDVTAYAYTPTGIPGTA